VNAYNAWMIDEWCGGLAPGSFQPHSCSHPAGWTDRGRPRRRAHRGRKAARTFAFSELPEPLGSPTTMNPGRYWDPVMSGPRHERHGREHANVGRQKKEKKSDDAGRSRPRFRRPLAPTVTFRPGAGAAGRCLGVVVFHLTILSAMPDLNIRWSEEPSGWNARYFIERAEQVLEQRSGIGRQRPGCSATGRLGHRGDGVVGSKRNLVTPTCGARFAKPQVSRLLHRGEPSPCPCRKPRHHRPKTTSNDRDATIRNSRTPTTWPDLSFEVPRQTVGTQNSRGPTQRQDSCGGTPNGLPVFTAYRAHLDLGSVKTYAAISSSLSVACARRIGPQWVFVPVGPALTP